MFFGMNPRPFYNVCMSYTHRYASSLSSLNAFEGLPLEFVRDGDPATFDETTHQRNNVNYDRINGKPLLPSPTFNKKDRYTIKSIQVLSEGGEGDSEGEGGGVAGEENNYKGASAAKAYRVDWADGVSSTYTNQWIWDQKCRWTNARVSRTLWTDLVEDDVRKDLSVDFQTLIAPSGPTTTSSSSHSQQHRALRAIYEHGILLVTQTPTDDDGAGLAALASVLSGGSVTALPTTTGTPSSLLQNYRSGGRDIVLPHSTGGPYRTLYGSIWFTSTNHQVEGTSVADSAYGQDSLPLHTDMTYMQLPPGLQIFTMVQPADHGGESTYADGFAVAQQLKEENPEAFRVLSEQHRTYHCVDDKTGWNLRAQGPLIEVRNGEFIRIRHNDLDRLPDLPPLPLSGRGGGGVGADEFYDNLRSAHMAWDAILARDSFRLVMALRRGDTVVLANQRCMHGRHRFQTSANSSRAVMGCYVNQEELDSRLRMEGFSIP